MGADTKANSRAAAYLRVVIIVSLRMAASAEAPSSLMLLSPILQARGGVGMVREETCQWALTEKQTFGRGGAPQGGDLRLLEDGGERGGTLVSNLVVSETASEGWGGDCERSKRVNGR